MNLRALLATTSLVLMAGPALAQDMNFNRIASFPVAANTPDAEESSAEIIAATGDGMTLIYSDSPAGVIGFGDIADPANPVAAGAFALPNGEPTAVSALGNTVFVAENTSESFTNPSGVLHAIDAGSRNVIASCDLGGQPDSTAIAPDGSFITVAIENERDEDLGDGRVPQMPTGYLVIQPLGQNGAMACDAQIRVDLTGLAAIAGEDPEPEFVDAIRITREGQPAQLMDMEGISLDGEGGFWVASEGRSDRLVPHAIYHIGADGAIEDYIALPNELLAVETRFGFEGITRVDDMLYIAVQREWRDDPENHVKVLGYSLETETWSVAHYPLTKASTGWVGLSEIVAHGDHLYFVERDNQLGDAAATKLITRVSMDQMAGMVALGETLPVLSKEVVVDLLPYLTSTGGYVLDKVEGLAIAADGTMWVSTDNDSVDDHSGETMLFAISGQ